MENNKEKTWEQYPHLYTGNIKLFIKDVSSPSPIEDVYLKMNFYKSKDCRIHGSYKIISKNII